MTKAKRADALLAQAREWQGGRSATPMQWDAAGAYDILDDVPWADANETVLDYDSMVSAALSEVAALGFDLE